MKPRNDSLDILSIPLINPISDFVALKKFSTKIDRPFIRAVFVVFTQQFMSISLPINRALIEMGTFRISFLQQIPLLYDRNLVI